MVNRARLAVTLLLVFVLSFGAVPAVQAEDFYWGETSERITVYNPDIGKYMQFFKYYSGTGGKLAGLILDADGGLLDSFLFPEFNVSTLAGAVYDSHNKRYIVAMEYYGQDEQLIYYVVLDGMDPGDAEQGFGIDTICDGFCGSSLSIALDPVHGGFAVAYIFYDDAGAGLHVTYIDGEGNQYSLNSVVESSIYDLKIVHDSGNANRFLLTWTESEQDEAKLVGQYAHIAYDGDAYQWHVDDPFTIASLEEAYIHFAMAPNGKDGVAIVWESSDDEVSVAKAVYGEPVSGSRAFVLDDTRQYEGMTSLHMAYDGQGQYAVLIGRDYLANPNLEVFETFLHGLTLNESLQQTGPLIQLAHHVEAMEPHLAHHETLRRIDYVFWTIYGPVLLPFGTAYEPPPLPPVFADPVLSSDPGGHYMMLSKGQTTEHKDVLQVHRFVQNEQSDVLVPIGSLGEADAVDFDMTYGNGQHLAVWTMEDWVTDEMKMYGQYMSINDETPGSHDFEVPVPEQAWIADLSLHYDAANEQFMLFYVLHADQAYKVYAQSIAGNVTVQSGELFTFDDYSGLQFVMMDDNRIVALWTDYQDVLYMRDLEVNADGIVERVDDVLHTIDLEHWLFYDYPFRAVHNPSGTEPQLFMGTVVSHNVTYEQEIHVATLTFMDGQWHLGYVEAIGLGSQFSHLLDFDLYSGGVLKGGPVVAWIWKNYDGTPTMTIKNLESGWSADIQHHADDFVDGGKIQLVPGKNRLNLFTELHTEYPIFRDLGTGLLAIALDVEQDLLDFGVGDRISMQDVVRYVQSLDFNRVGLALMESLDQLLEMIQPIHERYMMP